MNNYETKTPTGFVRTLHKAINHTRLREKEIWNVKQTPATQDRSGPVVANEHRMGIDAGDV